ncbi:Spermidine/putrescine import ATP-binding protein PotA [Leclercia adecarboxylata]|uniref:Spermidine/putrescine import ATP-binding protein PotA n=1 Tax=Leclercia adecarboxylata TaxID=83655 RepID=A0A4U9HXI5_9ENTR|nr:Spermidine/putrescine import ATP-binding protein PotA [Leclercia adecarboxylata]
MTILENVAYGLMVKGINKTTRQAQAREALEKVGLSFAETRKPSQLSGGQRQRVAIARALVNQPRVLLLDEPLGALDLKLREQMQFELKKLQQELGITFIFVTHDQGEALSMSDRVAVFNNGRIEQVDTPHELYLRPRTPFVASFVGTSNVFTDALAQRVCGLSGSYSLRPEHIRLDGEGEIQVQGRVQAVQFQGAATRFELRLAEGEKLLVSQANLTGTTPGTGWSQGRWSPPRGRATPWCRCMRRGEMDMSVSPPPASHGLSGRLSALFWRRPALGLFLLLLGPLMWFGIVYLGSLFALLWQGFYTFDDFTMSVTPDLTFANIRALFNPANYDIILRTLTMAIAVTLGCAILAFPMAWYMARYTRGKWKPFSISQ